ncbi:hypothetical protein [Rhizobium leguminosarum]|uniref:hypothetical protein n=1 Tax=Rhizobium leguminosarum TaxID=384 RepID=UPI0004847EC8|nr:hypothetical protein [Rhizobium leguminosarum]
MTLSKPKFRAAGFFRLERLGPDAWTFVDPDGNAFVSIGLNHGEETNLKYPHNIDIWRRKYGSREKWMREGFLADIKSWGFNTVGWTQEFISGDIDEEQDWFGEPFDIGHSPGWTSAELKASGMPYVVPIRVAPIEDWNGNPAFPDVFSKDFDVHCQFLARSICYDHADSKNLLGYFFVDIASWVPHQTGRFFPGFEGLKGDAYDKKLFEVATKYYETITRHIKAIDPNHLILGDRYNGNKLIPTPVLEAFKPYVDVLSIQYFGGPSEADRKKMIDDLAGWQKIADKPVINADMGTWTATKLNPNRASKLDSQAARGADYVASIGAQFSQPWFIGWHWCAYVENLARGWGLKDPWDEPYRDMVDPVTKFNKSAAEEWQTRVAKLHENA